MQRALIIFAVILLVTVSLVVGALSANWPFWQRAWQWQAAGTGWPENLPGPEALLRGGANARPLHYVDDPMLADRTRGTTTQALLLATPAGQVRAWFAPGFDPHTRIDGRGLAAGLLTPLYGRLLLRHPGLLDAPVGAALDEWKLDRRGAISARQLFWQLSGLAAGEFRPLNPFNARAQLVAGPDFGRAALRMRGVYPPGSHFEESAANAQLLALVAARLERRTFASVLETQLWSRVAADDAFAMLDHRRGDVAAHCCLRASIGDWLRVGLLLVDDGPGLTGPLLPAGFSDEVVRSSAVHSDYGLGVRLAPAQAAGRALIFDTPGRQLLVDRARGLVLLWVGSGPAPMDLQQLLSADIGRSTADNSAGK
jgi:hypothetical protein